MDVNRLQVLMFACVLDLLLNQILLSYFPPLWTGYLYSLPLNMVVFEAGSFIRQVSNSLLLGMTLASGAGETGVWHMSSL